jgi:hypothetical protein
MPRQFRPASTDDLAAKMDAYVAWYLATERVRLALLDATARGVASRTK